MQNVTSLCHWYSHVMPRVDVDLWTAFDGLIDALYSAPHSYIYPKSKKKKIGSISLGNYRTSNLFLRIEPRKQLCPGGRLRYT
jgi:hypothetical protein